MVPKLDCILESLVSFLKYKFQPKSEHTHLYVETAAVKQCIGRIHSTCTCMDSTSKKLARGSLERETRDERVRRGIETHCSFVLFKCCVFYCVHALSI